MSTSKVSSPLKYSIATFLLCTSALATGLSIYPISLAIFNATAIPLLFVAIASVSAIVALSSAVYLIKSAISAINTCVALEEKPHSNDISAKTPVATTIQPSLPTLNSKEPVTNSDTSTKIPEKIPVTLGTAILQVSPVSVPPPPPLPNQGVSTLFTPPPPPPFPSQNSSISSLPGQNFSMSYNFSMQIRKGHKLKKVESQIGSNVGSNDPRANLLKAIREGIKLKKVESQIESNVGSNDPRANLLKEIRAGIQLKKVESQKSNEANTSKQAKNQKGDKISAIRRENVAQILARRVHVEFSNSESEHSGNESDWSDDDQASNKKEEKKLIETQKSMPSTITSSEIESNSGPFIPPPPLPSQDVSVPPPPPLSTEGLNNWKPLKNSDISKKSLGSTTSKNLSHNKQKSLTVITPELLQEHLKKMRKKIKTRKILQKNQMWK